MTIFYTSSDPSKRKNVLAKIHVDFFLVLCTFFVVLSFHAFSFMNYISAVEATMAKNDDNKTADNNNNNDKTKPDY